MRTLDCSDTLVEIKESQRTGMKLLFDDRLMLVKEHTPAASSLGHDHIGGAPFAYGFTSQFVPSLSQGLFGHAYYGWILCHPKNEDRSHTVRT